MSGHFVLTTCPRTEHAIRLGAGGVYPSDYGVGACSSWDAALPPVCAQANGTALDDTAPALCSARWCWVDPTVCAAPRYSAVRSVQPELASTGLAFSYQSCGLQGTWQAWRDGEAAVPPLRAHSSTVRESLMHATT